MLESLSSFLLSSRYLILPNKWIDFSLTQISQMHQMVDHYTCDRTHYNPKDSEQMASSTTPSHFFSMSFHFNSSFTLLISFILAVASSIIGFGHITVAYRNPSSRFAFGSHHNLQPSGMNDQNDKRLYSKSKWKYH